MKKIVLFLAICIFVEASVLSKEQTKKLNTPVVLDKNGTLTIEEYSKVTFTKPVLFDNKKVDEIIIKTKATMKKDTIHKEQFIAMSSTVSSQMTQSILFSPEYFENLKTSELLVSKPMQNPDLNVEILFTDKGLDTKLYSTNRKLEHFISYSDMFLSKIKP